MENKTLKKELNIVDLSNLTEANIDFSNMTNHMIDCIKIGSKHQMLEKINEIKAKIYILNQTPYDICEYAEEHVQELYTLIHELNLNFAMYINTRTHQITNTKN